MDTKPAFEVIQEAPFPLDAVLRQPKNEDNKHDISKPFSQSVGTYSMVYATNGWLAIRIPNQLRLAETERQMPDMAVLPWAHGGDGWQPYPAQDWQRQYGRCPACLGGGLDDAGHSCQQCKATGWAEAPTVQWLDDEIAVSAAWDALARRFEPFGLRWRRCEGYTPTEGKPPYAPVQLAFSGGEGLLMPIDPAFMAELQTEGK